jgi:hypothetical protein
LLQKLLDIACRNRQLLHVLFIVPSSSFFSPAKIEAPTDDTKVEDKKSPEKKPEKSFEDITIKKWTDEERAAKRAARFEASQNLSNLTEAVVSKDKDLTSETKKQSRAERFGLSTKIGGAPSADLETLKKRAERFGASSSSVMKKAEMDEKGTIHILRKHFYTGCLTLKCPKVNCSEG